MKQLRDRYKNQDDATLIASVLAGEREAFDILLARYSSSVLHLCTALLGNTFEAQDIVQEASLQAFLGLARLQEPACFAAWFHAIAANQARSALRRRREHSLSTLSDDATPQVLWIDAPSTLEEYEVLREIHEAILLALGDLSEVNRQAVIGFYMQGYSYEELAQLYGVPISTVKGRLFQGRKLLKTLLRPLADTFLQPIDMQRKEQKVSAAYGDKKAVLQELPGKFGGVMVAAVQPSGWRLVVIFAEKPARDLEEETHQSIRQMRQELSDILTQ